MPLSLDSPLWSELRHAYGPASDIPALLRQLRTLPKDEADAEPWHSLWSSLAHQGDVFQASFAAVPHVVDAMAANPIPAPEVFFNFVAWIEICRLRQGVEVSEEIQHDYFTALQQIPQLAANAAAGDWSESYLRCALAAIAASKGQAAIAEAVLELSPEIAERFLDDVFG